MYDVVFVFTAVSGLVAVMANGLFVREGRPVHCGIGGKNKQYHEMRCK